VCEYHLHCHKAFELRPQTILKLLRALDAFRRPERFEQFLESCEADARGRLGLEDREYPQVDYLRAAREAAAGVDPQTLMAQGFEGAQLGRALDRARLEALANLKNTYGVPGKP
jgi:tRNA nucleotidyltransferase (CCA-adding enzyme)